MHSLACGCLAGPQRGLFVGDDIGMGKYLDKINSPADLKRLPVAELQPLAEEIRQFILRCVSKEGGIWPATSGRSN